MRQSLTDCAFFRREATNDYCVRFYPTIFLAVDCYSCSMYKQKSAEHSPSDPKSINLEHLGLSAANPNGGIAVPETLKEEADYGKSGTSYNRGGILNETNA